MQMLCNLRRALQALPPRELQMLYMVRVLKVEQEEARRIYAVRQSNISYRLDRAKSRIKLHDEMLSLVSETQLRRKLLELGLPENTIRAVTGVVRTTSQTAAAEALKISQGSVRHMFSQAIKRLEETEPTAPELELLKLVERSYNQLRAISSQQRWIWKKSAGGGDVPNPDDE
jgi:DNA-directed RNA polymerase specialized sigma24 family protein